jgi:dolichol-phosphate mannosyltransferase
VTPRVSIVIPAFNEGEAIIRCLDLVFAAVAIPCEVLIVYDSPDDTTAPYVEKYAAADDRVRATLNDYGRGAAHAIRYGIDHSDAPVVVVTMADGSDDTEQIEQLTRLVERGVVIAAASRYVKGGQQIGGPRLKGLISRLAGLSLHWLAGVGTHDPTNSFKAYSRNFVRSVGIRSEVGFALGIEMVAKARRLRLPVAEIPTIWLDRTTGSSNFRLAAWAPHYLRWYFFAFGPRLTREVLRERAG